MTNLQILALCIFAAALIANTALAIYFGERISASRIPMQWGVDGNPTWYAPRSVGLWWGLLFVFVVDSALFIGARFVEKSETPPFCYSVMIVSVTITLAQAWSLNRTFKRAVRD